MQTNVFESEGDSRTTEVMRAAHRCYIQNLTMDAIASKLTISRSSVSRLIVIARDSGLVEIRLHSPIDQLTQLQHQLHDRFGLTAHVVPTRDAVTENDRLDRDMMIDARILTVFTDSTMILGVPWESTIASVSRYLVRKPVRNTQVIQLNGAGNAHTTGLVYAGGIIGRFGVAFGATVQQFPVPAFFDDPVTKEAFWRERSTAQVLTVQRRMEIGARHWITECRCAKPCLRWWISRPRGLRRPSQRERGRQHFHNLLPRGRQP